VSDSIIKETGRWGDGTAHQRSYASAPHSGQLAVVHGYGLSSEEGMRSHIPGACHCGNEISGV
jgi:hypothetical protein